MTLLENHPLIDLNTFGIAARARYFLEVSSPEQLRTFLKHSPPQPVLVLGGGSNILFTGNFPGTILQNSIKGKTIHWQDEESAIIAVGGGENWHEFVVWCIDHDLGGVENLSLIPGRVGAAPIQNIGAYGVELKDVFHQLEAIELKTGQLHTFNRTDCQFDYRNSIFKQSLKGLYCITKVYLRLTKTRHLLHISYGAIRDVLANAKIFTPTIRDISNAVIRIRTQKLPDPKKIGNAGSFFKNPIIENSFFETLVRKFPKLPHFPADANHKKIPAGWLIEACGWKGKQFANVGVYEHQALVLVNFGKGTGEEIWALAQKIRNSVEEQFGIRLEPEVNIVG